MDFPTQDTVADARADSRTNRTRGHGVALADAVSKVPEVTMVFWIIKVLTTGMGETTSDHLVQHYDPPVMVAIGAVAFVTALLVQLSVRRYVPWVYWLAVTMVSVFGTMAADVLHVGLGVPYQISSMFFLIVLAAVFVLWRTTEKTLSFHSIHTRRREIFYWTAVVTTFALGTAVGDLTAVSFHLGYLASGILFAAAIAVPAIAHWRFGLKAVPAFWLAYILTRPVGASFADWLAVPAARGGLDWGTGQVSVALAVVIAGFVAYLALSRRRSGQWPAG
ncbi:hypothetical protein [Specibacter cremeus]|uniref:COG4705 family protein n=1 Tax=Specibacter cremeus TaxID=1629051 RepID=UPI000F79FB5A|nr:hypothetical protein [Specibacter cremeus]